MKKLNFNFFNSPILMPSHLKIIGIMEYNGFSQEFKNEISKHNLENKNFLFFYSLAFLRFDIMRYFLQKDSSFKIQFEHHFSNYFFHAKNEKIFLQFYKNNFKNDTSFYDSFGKFLHPEKHLFFLKKFSIPYFSYLENMFSSCLKHHKISFAFSLLKKHKNFIVYHTPFVKSLFKYITKQTNIDIDEEKILKIFSFICQKYSHFLNRDDLVSMFDSYFYIKLNIFSSTDLNFIQLSFKDKQKLLEKKYLFFNTLLTIFLENCSIDLNDSIIQNHPSYSSFKSHIIHYQLNQDLKHNEKKSLPIKI